MNNAKDTNPICKLGQEQPSGPSRPVVLSTHHPHYNTVPNSTKQKEKIQFYLMHYRMSHRFALIASFQENRISKQQTVLNRVSFSFLKIIL